jgi:vancomycin resistance protein YoaR
VALDPAYTFDAAAARALLADFAATINRDPVDATARWDDASQSVVVTPAVPGQKLDVHAAVPLVRAQVVDPLQAGRPAADTVALPYVDKPATIDEEDLAGIDTVLGTWTTSYTTSTKNRASNVAIAARALDNVVVLPDHTFSFNDEVGPRDSSRGFLPAPVIINGQLQPGMGGGVCQVSTTLYNAVLLANLQIVQRSHHSLPIHYAPPGQDATVAYGAIDFRFRNTTGAPLLILTRTERRRLTVQLLGHGPAPVVRIERSGITALPMPPARLKPDPTLPKGQKVLVEKGKPGVAVTVTRVVGDGPDATRETLSRDRYLGEAPVYRLGTKEPEPAPAPAAE